MRQVPHRPPSLRAAAGASGRRGALGKLDAELRDGERERGAHLSWQPDATWKLVGYLSPEGDHHKRRSVEMLSHIKGQ
ncbi:unnamed protein product [Lampetra fluviatilis]